MRVEDAEQTMCHRGGIEFEGRSFTGKCISEECMAWRWLRDKEIKAYLAAVQKHFTDSKKPNLNTSYQEVWAEHGQDFEHTEGYCGLVGKP